MITVCLVCSSVCPGSDSVVDDVDGDALGDISDVTVVTGELVTSEKNKVENKQASMLKHYYGMRVVTFVGKQGIIELREMNFHNVKNNHINMFFIVIDSH